MIGAVRLFAAISGQKEDRMFRNKIATIMVSLWAAFSVSGFVTPVAAQSVIEDAAPHPMVPLPADGGITHDVFTDFAVLEFPASPGDRGNAFEQTVAAEGEYRQMEYTVEGLELSLLRLYRGYLQHFESNDFEIIFSGIGEELSIRDGFTFISYESGFLSRTPSTSQDSNAYIRRTRQRPDADSYRPRQTLERP